RTVAVFGVAGPHCVTASPTGARLVVTHIREEVVIGSLGFRDRAGLRSGHLNRQRLDLPIRRNQAVRRNQPVHGRGHDARYLVFALELRVIAARVFQVRDSAFRRTSSGYRTQAPASSAFWWEP